MRILQVNIFYNEGSTGRIVAEIHKSLLRDGHESYVVYGRGDDWDKIDGEHLYRTTTTRQSEIYRKISRVTGLRYNTAYIETYRLIRYIRKINPDLVHLHCMNCAYVQPYILLNFLAKNHYPVLVTHHADVTITANCDHAFECDKWKTGCGNCPTNISERRSFFIDGTHLSWTQMKKAFSKVKNLYASGVSDWMTNRVKISPFFSDKECITIKNGLNIGIFNYKGRCESLRGSLGISQNDKIALHITPNFHDPNKGSKYILELSKNMPDVKFLIVGVSNINNVQLPDNVIIIPPTKSQSQLAEYYSIADITLLTSYRESFSMVAAESLSCGTPVVGFKAGAPETISIPEYSSFVEYGDIDALRSQVYRFFANPLDKELVSHNSQNVYNSEFMCRSYIDYYNRIINNKKL